MKRKVQFFLMLVACFLLPISAKASDYGIEQFQMQAIVLENGDFHVKEIFAMNGSYNGMERNLSFINEDAKVFTGDLESFEGSDIYNGTGIELIQIRAIPYQESISFEEMETSGTKFKLVEDADEGDFGVYTEEENGSTMSYRIYNPSEKKTFFYLEYKIKNLGIIHDDIAEIGWNIFDDSFRESIHHFKADIYIPNNQELLRAWAHGPLVGNIKIDGTNHIEIIIDELYENTAMDTRFIFDKEAINSTKLSHVEAFDKIIEVETKWADEANERREEYRQELERQEKINYIMTIVVAILGGAWTIGILILVYYVYTKHDKEYETTFKTKYFRDFPADYNPSIVGYLFHQNISNNDLSACLLNLIYKKVVTFEPLTKKDYKLIYHETDIPLTDSDRHLIKLIFNKNEITLKELKKRARNGYQGFLNNFQLWKSMSLKEALQEQFYENKNTIKVLASIYSVIGIFLSIVTLNFILPFGIILLALSITTLIYFLAFTKKTQKGIEHYSKWNGLKNFMEDFGTIDKKDLPEIVLWEKYLVYAVSLGCADKLEKTMQLRINEFNETDMINFSYSMHTMRDMMIFSHVMTSSVNTAVNNAYSAQSIANSSNSSGGGFGGGFSGGGGSFGGGSGGGRF